MAEHTMDVDQGGGRERRVPVDYPSNSKNPNPNPEPEGVRPPVEKIVTGRVTRKKTYGGTFVSDTLRSIGQYVWTDDAAVAQGHAVRHDIGRSAPRALRFRADSNRI